MDAPPLRGSLRLAPAGRYRLCACSSPRPRRRHGLEVGLRPSSPSPFSSPRVSLRAGGRSEEGVSWRTVSLTPVLTNLRRQAACPPARLTGIPLPFQAASGSRSLQGRWPVNRLRIQPNVAVELETVSLQLLAQLAPQASRNTAVFTHDLPATPGVPSLFP